MRPGSDVFALATGKLSGISDSRIAAFSDVHVTGDWRSTRVHRCLDRSKQFSRAKRLLQAHHVGEFGGCGEKVERRYSRNSDDRQIRRAVAQHSHDIGAVHAAQENIDNGEIERRLCERRQTRRAAFDSQPPQSL
jgi:hypothetical protein